MKKISIYITLIIGMIIASCENDLEIVNPNQPTIVVFWKNATDAEQGVNAIYSTLHRGAISRWQPMMGISLSDEGMSKSPWTDLANALDKFIIPNYNFDIVRDVWRDNYIGIFRANQVLAYVPAIEMDATLKNRYLGEAYFLRGFFYFNLATLWGNVPLMLTPSTPTDRPSTASQAAVWAQIEADLTQAIANLPEKYTDSKDLGRATKGAANALLAKALMQQQKYQQALTPLQWLVTGPGATIYSLMPDYRDNFLVTTENNSESVFEWQFQENLTERTDDDVATPQHNYGTSIAQFLAPRGIGWSDMQSNRWMIREFEREQTVSGERDPRLAATFIYDSTDVRGPEFTMVYGQNFAQRYGANSEVWFRKFLNDHWKNEEGYRSPNNYRYIRYADVLLMYAECLNETGSTTAAYEFVDRVRERAGLAPLSQVKPGLSKEDFLSQIKTERLLELCGEGHRWNDLARWGDLGPELAFRDPAFANFVKGKNELLPIPQQDLDINPNLKQNPNW
ncbi:MAG: RagB/SusD family nutrient uptake outer membrane protein [Methylococcaceae bacterium]